MSASGGARSGRDAADARALSLAGTALQRSAPLPVRQPADTSVLFVRVKLKENHASGDYLVCALLLADGSEGAQVKVARPPDLQKTRTDGQTVDGATLTWTGTDTLTADNGTDDPETWKVTPSYVADWDVLYVFKPANGTGAVDADGAAISWQDANVGARAWAVSTA